jgi:hypothetical protein
VLSAFSALAALASAYTQPDYTQNPSGNPIGLPGLNQQVPAGEPFTITWDPTTAGTVSLILLRGPSTNVVPIATLADAIPNSGSFVWTPATTLEGDVTHYGLLLVVEGTGQYQYSTQFGIENNTPAVSSTASAETTAVAQPTSLSSIAVATKIQSYSIPTSSTKTTFVIAPTGTGHVPIPFVPPTAIPTVPTSLRPSYTSPASTPVYTGAAGRQAVNVGGAVAAGVLALLAF